ncbi:ABC-type transport system involved in cytochrome c biogenesis, permease component [Owenweeksia hongkongensis DSM 17368]|uniref:Heme exporter protein C n=1 Tax=Owenweeksia hongkongensis (strain DSM 17368 / CIP 108786 / JCM 12287 / NRRL B-23963 / UST20020801) TaxID=926562 RepID=G8R7A6_OWEHD|nr:cytochrome c biogenesis protein CcsA [Owenweeksia hongkongensis]AEV31217.1 ABC-type transport system involved in cytochrome c biogenesis, permease component [Owenweeksia hongkongensis DSM 17368]
MKKHWWKALGVLLVLYTIVFGFTGEVPRLPILNETIRNLYFHVTMWFSMVILMTSSLVYSIKYLRNGDLYADLKGKELAITGFFMASLGLLTGAVWAKFTWGTWWTNDPKLNGTAVTMLIYLAYFVLRGSVDDPQKRGRLSAVYNIFAYVMMIVFIGILPRLTDSLHPGNGGNPGFGGYDLDGTMRIVFYPAIIGWTLIGLWITSLKIRYQKLLWKKDV